MTEMQQQRSSKLERLVEWYDRSEASKSRLAKPLLRVGVFIWFCWRELRRKRAEGMAALRFPPGSQDQHWSCVHYPAGREGCVDRYGRA